MRVVRRRFPRLSTEAVTLLELMVVLIIVCIVAFLAIFSAQIVSEWSKARVCVANLKVLKNALDLYMLDHDRMPQNLSRIPSVYIQRSLLQALSQPRTWPTRLAYWVVAREEQGFAYAAPFITDLARIDIGIVTCPKDPTPPPDGVSYGLYSGLRGMTAREYMEMNGTQALIGDSDSVTVAAAAALVKRHSFLPSGKKFYQGIRKDGTLLK